jgi:hypothetical protein
MPGGRIGRRWRSRHRTDLSFEDAEEQVLNALVRGRLRGTGLRNGEGDRQRISQDQWADSQFFWTRPRQGFHLSPLSPSVELSRGYVGPRDRLRANATYWTQVGFERDQVLALWPASVRDPLRAETRSMKLAEAVSIIAYGRELTGGMLEERRRQRHGGCFPTYVEAKLEKAEQRILDMIRKREVQADGFPCVRDEGTGRMNPSGDMARLEDDHAFLAHRLWVDLYADAIWTEPKLADEWFNPIDRGYRDINLDRTQFLAALERSHLQGREVSALPEPPPLEIPNREPGGSASKSLVAGIKRKGGRPAPWIKHLEAYLRLRLKRGDDILSASLAELRADFTRHVSFKLTSKVPSSRSSIDVQINKVRQRVVDEHRRWNELHADSLASMDEIVSMTDPPQWKRK